MYKIIGADQKEYGPISADQIRQWISEGRVNGQTQACLEGTLDWRPLETFPEFGFTAAQAAQPAGGETFGPATREEIVARDYTLDIGRCISRAWTLVMGNFGTLFSAFLLLLLTGFVTFLFVATILLIAGFTHLSGHLRLYLKPVYSIFFSLIMGPVLGGFFYVFISVIRGQPVSAGDIFKGFKQFQDLFLGYLIPALVMIVFMFPYSLARLPIDEKFDELVTSALNNLSSFNPQEFMAQLSAISNSSSSSTSMLIYFACMIPATYFWVNWQFTLPLIIDKKMDFWTAMRTSWRMVHKHWFHVFGLTVVLGVINVIGALCCCIGLIVTVPLMFAALMYAYEDIFGRQTA